MVVMEEFNGTDFVDMLRQLGIEGKEAFDDLDGALFSATNEDGLDKNIVRGLYSIQDLIDHHLTDDIVHTNEA